MIIELKNNGLNRREFFCYTVLLFYMSPFILILLTF